MLLPVLVLRDPKSPTMITISTLHSETLLRDTKTILSQ